MDWGGAAFKSGVHEVSGEIELIRPVQLHLALPNVESDSIPHGDTWRQEQIHAGVT